jgi:hypothetical protein
MPASLARLPPFVDMVLIGRFGYQVGLQRINALAITSIHGIIQISSQNLNVQVLGFVVFAFYRCFPFTIVLSFLPTFLGGGVLGRLLIFFSGVFAFVNIPLAVVASISTFGGNFFWPNLFYTVFVGPCDYVVWRIGSGLGG